MMSMLQYEIILLHLMTQCRNKKKKQPLDQLINVRLQQPNHCSLCDHVGKYTERKVTTVEYIKKMVKDICLCSAVQFAIHTCEFVCIHMLFAALLQAPTR